MIRLFKSPTPRKINLAGLLKSKRTWPVWVYGMALSEEWTEKEWKQMEEEASRLPQDYLF